MNAIPENDSIELLAIEQIRQENEFLAMAAGAEYGLLLASARERGDIGLMRRSYANAVNLAVEVSSGTPGWVRLAQVCEGNPERMFRLVATHFNEDGSLVGRDSHGTLYVTSDQAFYAVSSQRAMQRAQDEIKTIWIYVLGILLALVFVASVLRV